MSSSKGHSTCKYSSTFKLNHVYVHKIFSCGDDLRVNKDRQYEVSCRAASGWRLDKYKCDM